MTTQPSAGLRPRTCGILIFIMIFLMGNALVSKIQKDRYWTDGLRVEGLVIAVHTDTRSVNRVPRVVNEVIEFEYKIDDQVFDDSQSFYFDTAYFVGQRIPVMSQPVEPWTATMILDDPFNLKTYTPLAFSCGLMTLVGVRL